MLEVLGLVLIAAAIGAALVIAGTLALGFLILVPFLYDYIRFRRRIFTADPGPISGFALTYSVSRGEPIDLYVHSTAPARLTLHRLGSDWDQVGGETPIDPQQQSTRFDIGKGVPWRKSLTLDSSALEPGLYRIDLVHKGNALARFSIPMIVKPDRPSGLCVILSTTTWEAYNAFGDISHYENNHIGKLSRAIGKFLKRPNWFADFVSKRRPNILFDDEVTGPSFGKPYSSFIVRNELEFLVFLARKGFSFSLYCDDDLASMPDLQNANALIFPGHSEYWTDKMFYTLERAMARGAKIYFTNSSFEGHCVAKDGGWRFKTRPVEQFSNSLSGTHGTQDGALTAAPYRVLEPGHWVFAGTGLKAGDLFGENCVNTPTVDAIGHEHLQYEIDLTGQPMKGASGFFTGKTGYGSGAFTTLAIGTNPAGPSHMVYRDLPGGGWVFNPSSYSFNGALLHDEAIARLVENLMKNMAANPRSDRSKGEILIAAQQN